MRNCMLSYCWNTSRILTPKTHPYSPILTVIQKKNDNIIYFHNIPYQHRTCFKFNIPVIHNIGVMNLVFGTQHTYMANQIQTATLQYPPNQTRHTDISQRQYSYISCTLLLTAYALYKCRAIFLRVWDRISVHYNDTQ